MKSTSLSLSLSLSSSNLESTLAAAAVPGSTKEPADPPAPKLSAYPGAMPDARRLTRAELERLRRQTREASVALKAEVEGRKTQNLPPP